MGRHCGDLALYAGIAGGAESVIVPELGFDKAELCKTIMEGKNKGKRGQKNATVRSFTSNIERKIHWNNFQKLERIRKCNQCSSS